MGRFVQFNKWESLTASATHHGVGDIAKRLANRGRGNGRGGHLAEEFSARKHGLQGCRGLLGNRLGASPRSARSGRVDWRCVVAAKGEQISTALSFLRRRQLREGQARETLCWGAPSTWTPLAFAALRVSLCVVAMGECGLGEERGRLQVAASRVASSRHVCSSGLGVFSVSGRWSRDSCLSPSSKKPSLIPRGLRSPRRRRPARRAPAASSSARPPARTRSARAIASCPRIVCANCLPASDSFCGEITIGISFFPPCFRLLDDHRMLLFVLLVNGQPLLPACNAAKSSPIPPASSSAGPPPITRAGSVATSPASAAARQFARAACANSKAAARRRALAPPAPQLTAGSRSSSRSRPGTLHALRANPATGRSTLTPRRGEGRTRTTTDEYIE